MEHPAYLHECVRRQLPELLKYLRYHEGVEVRDQLQLNRTQWDRLIQSRPMEFETTCRLLEALGLNFFSFLGPSLDYEACRKHLRGDYCYIPKAYLRAAYSSNRIGRNLLSILEDYYGSFLKLSLMRTLQIGESYFSPQNDHRTVCTLLYAKIYQTLKALYGFTDEDLYWIGQKTAFYNSDTPLQRKFSQKGVKDAYAEYLEEITRIVERSYDYELARLSEREVIFRKRPAGELQDILQTKLYGNHESCVYSIGFTTTIGFYANGAFPLAKKTRCLY